MNLKHLLFIHIWMAIRFPSIRPLCLGCAFQKISNLTDQERCEIVAWIKRCQAQILTKQADLLEGKL